jgi:hypothetical protein
VITSIQSKASHAMSPKMAAAIKQSGMDSEFVSRLDMAQRRVVALAVKLISLSPRVFTEDATRTLYKALYSQELPLIMGHGHLRAIMAVKQKMSEKAYVFCIRLISAMSLLIDAEHGGWDNASELDRLVWLSLGENAASELESDFQRLPEFAQWRDARLENSF